MGALELGLCCRTDLALTPGAHLAILGHVVPNLCLSLGFFGHKMF